MNAGASSRRHSGHALRCRWHRTRAGVAMTTSGLPLVRIDIDTDQETAKLWVRAREIKPSCLEWAANVRSVQTASGSVCVTVAISQDEYTNTVRGVGIEDAASALEAVMIHDAAAVVDQYEAAKAIRNIPHVDDVDEFGPYTLVVKWTVPEVIEVTQIAAIADGPLCGIRLARISNANEDDELCVAVSLPTNLYMQVNDYHRDDLSSDEFCRAVYRVIINTFDYEENSKLETTDPARRKETPYSKPLDDEIPF
jgi:hypothetical protein